jgi:hypothetical protein
MFTWKCEEKFKSCTLKKSYKPSWYIFSFLSDKFKDFKVDNTIFEKAILSKNTVLEISEIAI